MGKNFNKEAGLDLSNIFIPELGVTRVETFSSVYPMINHYILTQKKSESSRDGNVKEILDFTTKILNPYRRCVGGYGRNINVFFLLAEAIWIALGRKDVSFLTLFNKNMSNFSDDGMVFHAPYGYRLRHWGIRTEDSFVDDNLNASKGYDQVIDVIKILSENPNSRQAVMSIWNPNFDLGYKTKDIPCNDMVMLKVRDGKLITTIQNRSNDLHWGLPTNIFQFSFLTELIAGCLGIELGTQTHNSQSLHVYDWNEISKVMLFNESNPEYKGAADMYLEHNARERRIDFNFAHEIPANRFREIDCILNNIVDNLIKISIGGEETESEIKQIFDFSKYLFDVYQLLKLYLQYSKKLSYLKTVEEKDLSRHVSISEIELLEANMFDDDGRGAEGFNWDISMLAKNFFASRLNTKIEHEYLGTL